MLICDTVKREVGREVAGMEKFCDFFFLILFVFDKNRQVVAHIDRI